MADADEFEGKLGKLDPRERDQLRRLRERMKEGALTPEAVGNILPEALAIGEAGSRRLSRSMTEITERAIDLSVRRDPAVLSTALFPIIGSAIRKAINKLLADTMTNMNAGLEKTFSFRRMAWHLEAWKTGVPFMEIVLRKSLRFRVDHVFLIHGKTGILLRALSRAGAKTADDDMVASMLTAVRDYIKDSLALAGTEEVSGISAGEYSILVESGPRASLALVLRGNADGSLRTAMQEALEETHLRLAGELESFSGDTAPFEQADRIMGACLVSGEKNQRKKTPVLSIILVSFLAAAALFSGISGFLAAARRGAFVTALSREKGMLVASEKRSFGKTELRLLRDPRARSIDSVAGELKVDLADFVFEVEEFVSPAFGAADQSAVRTPSAELLALSRKLAAYTLLFEQDSGELRAGQEEAVREAGALIATIVQKAEAEGFQLSVEITGHSAGSVQDENSIAVSVDRAEKAMILFKALNAPVARYVRTRGVGVSEPVVSGESSEEDRIRNRSVTFKTIFR